MRGPEVWHLPHSNLLKAPYPETAVHEEETLHSTARFSDFSDKNVVHIFVPTVAQLCSDALCLKPTFFFPKVGQLKASCPGEVPENSPAKWSLFLGGVGGLMSSFLCAKGKEAIKTPGLGGIEQQVGA